MITSVLFLLPYLAFSAAAQPVAAAAGLEGSFIEAVEKGDPSLLKERIGRKLDGPASEFWRELKARKNGESFFVKLASVPAHQEEFAGILLGLMHLIEPDLGERQALIRANIKLKRSERFHASASEAMSKAGLRESAMNIRHTSTLNQIQEVLEALSSHASARDAFSYYHYGNGRSAAPWRAHLRAQEAEWYAADGGKRLLGPRYNAKINRRSIYQGDLLGAAIQAGNWPAYKALKGDGLLAENLMLGLSGSMIGAMAMLHSMPQVFYDNSLWLLPAGALAAGAASVACRKVFQRSQFKRNARRQKMAGGQEGLPAFK